MTPAQRSLVLSLMIGPQGGPELSADEFLRRFDAADGRSLGAALLRDALARQDPLDVEMALIVTGTFGVTREHLESLIQLATAEWHTAHEDVVTSLGRLQAPEAVGALYAATQNVPPYLEFDENRGLADKAIRALAKIPGESARQALLSLSTSYDETVARSAQRELGRRDARDGEGGPGVSA